MFLFFTELEETFDNPEWIFKDATCDTLELMSEKNFESFTDVLSMPLFKEFGLDDLEYKTGGDDTRPGSNVRKVEAWLFQTDIVDENVEEIPGTSLQEIHDQTVDSNDDKSSILSNVLFLISHIFKWMFGTNTLCLHRF